MENDQAFVKTDDEGQSMNRWVVSRSVPMLSPI